MTTRTLIVDDEGLARERLQHMLRDVDDIEIIGEASNGFEAVEKIKALRPDLAFLDIEMPGFNGFKVVQALGDYPMPKVIFVTAYNQYAIEAFEIGALDYLLKPVKKDRLLAALTRAQARTHAERHDLSVARDVQKRLLPSQDLKLSNLEVAGACIARDEVGGDYYDFIRLAPEVLGICVADISGKGFSAALMMANLQAMLRLLSKDYKEPAALITEVNRSFYENSITEMYATLFYGTFDAGRQSFTFCNAGHNPPFLFSRNGFRKLDSGGTVVGMFADSKFDQQTLHLNPGEIIVIYSDGLVELNNDSGEEFGEQRLKDLVADNLHLSSSELKDLILDSANRFCTNRNWQDDLTVVVLRATENNSLEI